MASSPPSIPIRGEGNPYTMRPASPIPHQRQHPWLSPLDSNKSGNDNTQQDQEDPCKSSDESSLGAADTASEEDDLELAVKTINNLYRGHYPLKDNVTFTLRKSSYDVLHRRLDSNVLDYFDDEVRSSWYPDTDTGKLTIQAMPTGIHEETLAALRVDIHVQLNKIVEASNGALQPFRDNLKDAGSTTIGEERNSSRGYKSPDWQLRYEGWGTTFVLEVAYTQTQDSVEETASKYFDIEPSVCSVFVIHITSRPEEERLQGCKHRAAFSLWTREGGKEPFVENTVFRENDGRVFPGSLTIPFEFLLPLRERTKHPKIQSAGLTFSYESLATFIQEAEGGERELLERRQKRRQKRRQEAAEPQEQDGVDVTTSNDQRTSFMIQQAQQDVQDFYDDHELERAVETIDNLYRGRYPPSDNPTFALSELSYDLLRQRLDSDVLEYFDNKVRSSWNPDTRELTIRVMLTCIPDVMIRALGFAISVQLNKIAKANGGALQSIRAKLSECGSASLGFKKENASFGHEEPDGQYRFEGYSETFVYEVAYSQERTNAEQKAMNYFRWTRTVCTVLIINITKRSVEERRKGCKHRAAVSLWVADRGGSSVEDKVSSEGDESVEDEVLSIRALVENMDFRNDKGVALEGVLRIPFASFLPPGEGNEDRAIQDAVLEFSYESLAEMIEEGEKNQHYQDEKEARQEVDGPHKPLTLRVHSKSGTKDFLSKDQHTFAMERAMERAQRAVQNVKASGYQKNDLTFVLNVSFYRKLLEGLTAHNLLRYFLEEARTDWNPQTGKLTLRRTKTPQINAYVQGLRKVLEEAIMESGKSRHDKKLRENLCNSHHTVIGSKQAIYYAHFSPDDQFYLPDKTSSFVVDVIYTPKSGDIKARVLEYFQGTDSVTTILTIEVNRGRCQVSLWDKTAQEDNPRAQGVFLDKDKTQQGILKIPFELFFPPEERAGVRPPGAKLAINYEQLADVFNFQPDHAELKINDDRPSSLKRPRIPRTSMAHKDRGVSHEGGEGQQKAKRSKVEDEKTKTTGRTAV
ncbi:hypothetical protein F4860DRAFT_73339 [Xylaria cubensis]|nr:hypothetical protein F4860DRAFT_73339 [Xylaria cubensis]